MTPKPDYDKQLSLIDEKIARLKLQKSEILKKKENAHNKEIIGIFKEGNISIDELKEFISSKKAPDALSQEDNGSNVVEKDDSKKEYTDNTEKEKNDK